MSSLTQSAAWRALLAHREVLSGTRISALWQADPNRGDKLTFSTAGIAVDLSKQRIAGETIALLTQLARERDVPAGIERLFTGERINTSENRPVLHTALRGDERVLVDGADIRPDVTRVHERMRMFTQGV